MSFDKIRIYLSLVKFSHSIFALPFAFSMLVVVNETHPVTLSQIIWIIVALVSARTAAMAFNRYLDKDIDAKNARTKNRELPKGLVSIKGVVILFLLSGVLFHYASFSLGLHCFYLAPVVLFALCFYSYTKRFTSFSHIVLGFGLALAPGGVWYALTATFALKPLYLMAGVLCWVAGFDVLYSCQDEEFDKQAGLYSVPVRLGIDKAFSLAKILHVSAVLFFILFAIVFSLGTVFYIGLAVFAASLFSQYVLIAPDDLHNIDVAFFNRNALASIIFFLAVFFDVFPL